MAYAHAHGVVHGDLKPDNLMLGPHGEVFVLDWGLARVVRYDRGAPGPEPAAASLLDLAELPETEPRIGGTLAYMAPERLWSPELEQSADVYALGALLYELLVGEPPYGREVTQGALLQRVASTAPAPVRLAAGERERPALPDVLADVVEAAMRREADDRLEGVAALGDDVGDWLEGTRQLQQAEELVAGARRARDELAEVRGEASQRRELAATLLAALPAQAPVEDKAEAWDLEAGAASSERWAARLEAELTEDLRAALALVEDLSEAHEMLAEHFRQKHQAAEESRDLLAAERFAVRLRHHDRPGRFVRYLQGDGALTLVTAPPGARAELFEVQREGRRQVLRRVRDLGTTPLVEVPLPMGSYVVRLRAEGCAEVTYPVHVRRGEHWHGRQPGDDGPWPVLLPAEGELEDGDCYVPAGWFGSGGDPHAPGSLPARRIWLDAFVIRRDPVTHAEFVAFLDDLVGQGREGEALSLAPRLGSSPGSGEGELLYGRSPDGCFTLDGGVAALPVTPDRPVVCVSWRAAAEYARWLILNSFRGWRLPGELEWEKAARGVDGRFFPWGDHLDPGWCCMRDSHPTHPGMAAVGDFPVDCSPYGVRGMAGNVRDWCLDAFRPDGPEVVDGGWFPAGDPPDGVPHVGRGGTWCVNPVGLRAAYRAWFAPTFRADDSLGFRLACSYPDDWNQ